MINKEYFIKEEKLFINNERKKSFHKKINSAIKKGRIAMLISITFIYIIASIFLLIKFIFFYYKILINDAQKIKEKENKITIDTPKIKSESFYKQINEYIILCRNGILINPKKNLN